MNISICKFTDNYACNFFSHHVISREKILPLKSFKLRRNISKVTGLQSRFQRQTAFGNLAGYQIRQLVQFCCGMAKCSAHLEQEALVPVMQVKSFEHSLIATTLKR